MVCSLLPVMVAGQVDSLLAAAASRIATLQELGKIK